MNEIKYSNIEDKTSYMPQGAICQSKLDTFVMQIGNPTTYLPIENVYILPMLNMQI